MCEHLGAVGITLPHKSTLVVTASMASCCGRPNQDAFMEECHPHRPVVYASALPNTGRVPNPNVQHTCPQAPSPSLELQQRLKHECVSSVPACDGEDPAPSLLLCPLTPCPSALPPRPLPSFSPFTPPSLLLCPGPKFHISNRCDRWGHGRELHLECNEAIMRYMRAVQRHSVKSRWYALRHG